MAEICNKCGKEYEVKTSSWEEPYHYTESGLPNILLINIPVYTCANCAVQSADIPNSDELHRLIAKDIILTPLPMSGLELRFLRKEAMLKPQDFADRLGVETRTIANWEKSPKLNRQTDILVRVSTVAELWQGDERTKVLGELADIVKYAWEQAEEEVEEQAPEQAVADLAAENVAYGLNENHEWRIAA